MASRRSTRPPRPTLLMRRRCCSTRGPRSTRSLTRPIPIRRCTSRATTTRSASRGSSWSAGRRRTRHAATGRRACTAAPRAGCSRWRRCCWTTAPTLRCAAPRARRPPSAPLCIKTTASRGSCWRRRLLRLRAGGLVAPRQRPGLLLRRRTSRRMMPQRRLRRVRRLVLRRPEDLPVRFLSACFFFLRLLWMWCPSRLHQAQVLS
mmetsp:Transcript_23208/g.92071  ORF Transcript_23208/g.92071 Transcript_23208/m.92071 type:complete len:205 (-) Transcript_23208:1886-2500(-)